MLVAVYSRKQAFKVAWQFFWFATGTRRVGVIIDPSTKQIDLVGDALIEEESE